MSRLNSLIQYYMRICRTESMDKSFLYFLPRFAHDVEEAYEHE